VNCRRTLSYTRARVAGAAIRRLAYGGLAAVERRHVLSHFPGGLAAWDWRVDASFLVGGRR